MQFCTVGRGDWQACMAGPRNMQNDLKLEETTEQKPCDMGNTIEKLLHPNGFLRGSFVSLRAPLLFDFDDPCYLLCVSITHTERRRLNRRTAHRSYRDKGRKER